MLRSPTVEKLQALHLHGLLTAWEEQERHPEAAELSFAERLGLLIDAEWTARENRRELHSGSPRPASRTSTSARPAASTRPWCGAWPPASGSPSTRT